jgi:hypothetical protein
MRHLLFAASFGAALGLWTTTTNAQSVPDQSPVPGRALLDFPLGTLGEIPALSTAAGGGLINPATILPLRAPKLAVAAASLNAPGERGVDGESVTVVDRIGRSGFALGIARMGVTGLERTGDGDTQVLGHVPYYTYVASLVAARRFAGPFHRHLVVGASARYRAAHADTTNASTGLLDVGAMADGLLGRRDVRLALSSYLWRPGRESVERPGLHAGADARVAGADAEHEARVGLGYDATRGGTSETGLYAAGRWTFLEARGGLVSATAFGDSQTRTRLALGFHSTRLLVTVGHEASGGGFGSIWQFTLSAQVR